MYNSSIKVKDCSTPKVTLSLEQLEYTVTEGIGKSFRALQICAVTTDLQFGIQASLQIHNGSATGNNYSFNHHVVVVYTF